VLVGNPPHTRSSTFTGPFTPLIYAALPHLSQLKAWPPYRATSPINPIFCQTPHQDLPLLQTTHYMKA